MTLAVESADTDFVSVGQPVLATEHDKNCSRKIER
jgi:hypothetical protein